MLSKEERRPVKTKQINFKYGDGTDGDLKTLQDKYPEWSLSEIIRACIRAEAERVRKGK